MADWEDAPSGNGGWEDSGTLPSPAKTSTKSSAVQDFGGLKQVPVPEVKPTSGYRTRVGAAIGQGPIEQEAKVPRKLSEQYLQTFKGLPIGAASSLMTGFGIPALGETLVRAGARKLGADVSAEPFLPTPERAGTYLFGKPKSEYEEAARYAGELLVPMKIGKATVTPPKLPAKDLDAFKKIADEKFGIGTKAAEDEYARLVQDATQRAEAGFEEARRSEVALRKRKEEPSRIPPEDEAIRSASRKQTQLLDPVNVADDMEKLAAVKWEAAQAKKAAGGKAYETFADAAKARETVQPFEATPQGRALFDELSSVAKGGEDALIRYTDAERKVASDIIKELYPRKAAVVSEEEVAKRAAQNPNRAMSQAAKMMQARKELQAAAEGAAETARPVNFEVVKKKAQELRALQEQRGGPAGFKVQVGERYQDPAKRIETALKEWVGEENWPASIYKEASKEANKFETELGEALRSQEKIPFRDEPGKFTTPRKELPRLVFRSKDDTRFAKELLGDAEVNRLGEAYASNEIKNLDSAGVAKWMENNDFYKEVPGLSEKLKQYQASLAEREGQKLALEGMQKGIERDIAATVDTYSQFLANIDKEIGQAAANKEKVVKTLNKAKELFRVKKASEISPKWEDIRVELEGTGLFNPQELDALGTSVAEAARSEARAQKVQEFFDKFKGLLSLKFLRKM